MDSTSKKRFVKALRHAEEIIVADAKCFCYSHDPEYQEVHEALKFATRTLERGDGFAGKLLYKNARRIAYTSALELARKAKSDEERNFFDYIADMNLRRARREFIRSAEPRCCKESEVQDG